MKRNIQERKRLAPELEAFARSDETRLRIRRPAVDRGKVDDPREGYAVAGVANRDARAVYEARASELVRLWRDGAAEAGVRATVGERLLDVRRLQLWRAQRVTGFAAFAEQVVGLSLAEAEALSEAAAARLGEPVTVLTERETALWLRTEAGLYEGDPQARAVLRSAGGKPVLSLSIQASVASLGLTGAGARHAPLARAQREEQGRPLASAPGSEPAVAGEPSVVDAGARLLRRRAGSTPGEAPTGEAPAPAERDDPTRATPAPEERPRFEKPRTRPDTRVERPRFQGGGARSTPDARVERPRFQGGGARAEGSRPVVERPRFERGRDVPRAEGDRPRFASRAVSPVDNRGERRTVQKHSDAGKPGDRPAFQKRGADGRADDRPTFQKRGAAGKAGARPAFGKKPPFRASTGPAGKGFGKGKSGPKGKGFGERKRYGAAQTGAVGRRGDQAQSTKKSSDDEG